MMTTPAVAAAHRSAPPGGTRAVGLVLERNLMSYRRAWWIFVTGFLEPVFYLFSIGIGVGKMVGVFEFGGQTVTYAAFVAPAMMAASAMNGAVLDATYNFFHKLKYDKLYDQMLATPLTVRDVARGELAWSLSRGGAYSVAFLAVMVTMGLVSSWWAVLTVPAALLTGAAFGALGMAITTFMRDWQDFDYIQLGQLPMFLFSATFFPLSSFPGWLAHIVEVTPLYRSVILIRELSTGAVGWASIVSVLYLVVLTWLGLRIAGRRLERALLA